VASFLQLSQTTILLGMVLLLLPSCQLTTKQDSTSETYGLYYLTLQQLSEQQLAEEVSKQQASINGQVKKSTQSYEDSQIKLILLYSLPKSPIYNSFNAKALLNKMQRDGENTAFAHIHPNDQALINLLRDQLNQRLLMRNRLLTQHRQRQEQQKQQALKQQQQLIEQVQLLEQTIKQLKNIEQAIDKREQ